MFSCFAHLKRRPRRIIWRPALLLVVQTLLAPVNAVGEVAKPDLLVSCEPFTPGGEVKLSDASATMRAAHKSENGSLNGVRYTISYEDGGATFQGERGDEREALSWWNRRNWDIGCKIDPITDRKSCHLNSGNFWIFQHAKGRPIVSIGADHYPGSTVAIRIDRSTPFNTSAVNDGSFSADTSARIVRALKKGSAVTTRYMEWPYRAWVDETFELLGFNEAFSYLTWAFDRIGESAGKGVTSCESTSPQPGPPAAPASSPALPASIPAERSPADDQLPLFADVPAGITATVSSSRPSASQISWVVSIQNATGSPMTVRGILSFLDNTSAVVAGKDLRTITLQPGAPEIMSGVLGVASDTNVQSVLITLRPL